MKLSIKFASILLATLFSFSAVADEITDEEAPSLVIDFSVLEALQEQKMEEHKKHITHHKKAHRHEIKVKKYEEPKIEVKLDKKPIAIEPKHKDDKQVLEMLEKESKIKPELKFNHKKPALHVHNHQQTTEMLEKESKMKPVEHHKEPVIEPKKIEPKLDHKNTINMLEKEVVSKPAVKPQVQVKPQIQAYDNQKTLKMLEQENKEHEKQVATKAAEKKEEKAIVEVKIEAPKKVETKVEPTKTVEVKKEEPKKKEEIITYPVEKKIEIVKTVKPIETTPMPIESATKAIVPETKVTIETAKPAQETQVEKKSLEKAPNVEVKLNEVAPSKTPVQVELKKEEKIEVKPTETKPSTAKPQESIKAEANKPDITVNTNKAAVAQPVMEKAAPEPKATKSDNVQLMTNEAKPAKSEPTKKIDEIKPQQATTAAKTNYIKFLPDEVDLNPEIEKQINSFIETIRKTPNARVRVVGYSASNEDSAHPGTSRRMALQRVVAVRKYMIQNNVDHLKIIVQAIGEDKESQLPKERVEIYIEV